MPYILNKANKPVQVSLGSPEFFDAATCYQTEAEAKQAQRDNCQHETRLGNRSTGRITCADCGELTDELVLVARGLLGSAAAAIRQKLDAPRTLEGLRQAAKGEAVASGAVAAQGISREQLAGLWREINNTCFDDPETPPYVRLAEALSLLPQCSGTPPLPFDEGEVDPKGDGFAAGIDVGEWFNRIEAYGHTAAEAKALRDYLLSCIAGTASTWLPMETAPKDRAVVLRRADGNTGTGFYDDQRFNRKPRPYWKDDRKYLGVDWMRKNEPTGWMEIPR